MSDPPALGSFRSDSPALGAGLSGSGPGAAQGEVPASVRVFASPSSWIESDALRQCEQVAALPGMLHVAGMPDLHPGKGAPVGAAMTSTLLYPHLAGSDIGCGITVFPITLRRADPERLAARFPNLDRALDPERDADHPAWAAVPDASPDGVPGGTPDSQGGQGGQGGLGGLGGLGTLGRGNHFAELARIGPLLSPVGAGIAGQVGSGGPDDAAGLAEGRLVLIVHSGSRAWGERILRAHTEGHGAAPAPDPAAYLAAHDQAVRWASVNRRVIAARIAHALGTELRDPLLDLTHNSIEPCEGGYLHRKGAAPGDGLVLVAGSRGTPSYPVTAHAGAQANFSIAHGAGRKMSRADALRRGQAKHTVRELRRTRLGSLVICGDRHLLFEEAPDAYKRIDQVVADLTSHDLATPLATTIPIITYKTPDAEPARHHEPPGPGRRPRRRR